MHRLPFFRTQTRHRIVLAAQGITVLIQRLLISHIKGSVAYSGIEFVVIRTRLAGVPVAEASQC